MSAGFSSASVRSAWEIRVDPEACFLLYLSASTTDSTSVNQCFCAGNGASLRACSSAAGWWRGAG